MIRLGMLLGLGLTLLPATGFAQAADTPVARIVVLRHGVRSPTGSPAELAPYANRPWVAWPVAPGMLTEHGEQGLVALGRRYRALFARDGLWSGSCQTRDQIEVIADSTPRNRASGAALLHGLSPDCPGSYLAQEPTQANPLFHFAEKNGGKDDDGAAPIPTEWPPAALTELQSLLLGCQGEACMADARAHQRKLLLDPAHDDDATRARALKQAGSLSENLMLEYAQGFPPPQVAWGAGDNATIGRLITLHNAQFALAKKSMPAAAQAGSNLLAHILATLQQAAGATPNVAPLVPRKVRAVLLVAHDTNLANLGGLLDIDWHDARQPDDYPPGGALVFDLLRTRQGYAVRISSWMPTLEALRQADLRADDSLVQHTLRLPPCADRDACPLADVAHWLSQRMDRAFVDPSTPAMPPNQP
ncbi:histidine-type phosphatase [Dyella sp. C9]|uniref:histidine-type phosphatase n=1 Tax=Dyella sp. C9 TaxID=2202154 RepID=UPI001300B072|nr:histidine-type phosphatase [Dyella sp. C9]